MVKGNGGIMHSALRMSTELFLGSCVPCVPVDFLVSFGALEPPSMNFPQFSSALSPRSPQTFPAFTTLLLVWQLRFLTFHLS